MRTYLMKVTDLHEFSLEVGELSLESGKITDSNVRNRSKRFAQELLEERPEMANKGLCLAISDEAGTIRLVAPMDTIH
jgi:hypothetical protein